VALIGSVETLKDSAIGIVVTSVLFAITLQSPLLGFFCTVIIPLPTMFCRAKHGRTIGMLVPAIALLALAPLLGGMSIDLLYFFELVFCGFVLYELLTLRLSVEKTVVLTSAATLAVGLFIVLVYSSTTAASLGQLVSDYVRRNLEASLRLYVSMGVPADTIRPIEDALDGIQYVLVRIVSLVGIGDPLSFLGQYAAGPAVAEKLPSVLPGLRTPQFMEGTRTVGLERHRIRSHADDSRAHRQAVRHQRFADLDDGLFFSGDRHHFVLLRKKTLSAAVADRFVQSHRPAANRSADRCGPGFFRHVVEFQETGGRKKITPARLEHCVSGMPPTGRRHVIRFWRFK
jgi:hypothetical protein